MRILCPGSCLELSQMLSWAVCEQSGPVAIRYPRGGDRDFTQSAFDSERGVFCHRTGKDLTLITYGTLLKNAMDAAELLAQKGLETTVLRLLCVEPLPIEQILSMISSNRHIVIMEEVAGNSGIGESLACTLYEKLSDCRVDRLDLGHRYITHGSIQDLYTHYHLDAQSVADYIMEVHSDEN